METRVEYVNEPRRLKGLSVLVLDDCVDNIELIAAVLQQTGATVHGATEIDRGLLKKLIPHYDVMLVDIQMPGMDGFEVMRILTQLKYRGSAIAVTAARMEDVFTPAMEAGFSTVITRPFSLNHLVECLHHLHRRVCH